MRLENLDDCGEWLAKKLNVSHLVFQNKHAAEEKWYASKYKEFLGNFRPTEEEIDLYYRCEIMNYFYTDNEIDSMIARWN